MLYFCISAKYNLFQFHAINRIKGITHAKTRCFEVFFVFEGVNSFFKKAEFVRLLFACSLACPIFQVRFVVFSQHTIPA